MSDNQASDKPSDNVDDAPRDCCSAARTCASTVATTAAASIDPVCGMPVDPATTPHRLTQAGVEHHFCSAHCRQAFVDSSAQASAAR
ncbi:YHS domain-containing protein [Lysobacter capsici]|uniref:YHS domain-containing protein n=1 Tax=Lysobacter capsici TaxID=435897 RepID=UPI0017816A7E|nr:YHS domain-containing protein [Lysobacter capsici]UOF15465.1 YHS domain-containing protein [Lysobacter capsici]